MKVFDCNQDETDEQLLDYQIDATNKWSLPGVHCPTCCATWSSTGIEYPTVDISNEAFADEYTTHAPVPLEQLEKLISRIRPHFPQRASLQPGTEFGKLIGRASGRFPDFAYAAPWKLLITRHAYAQLSAKNVRMPAAVSPDLRFPKGQVNDLWELEIQPLASLHATSFLPGYEHCTRCRRQLAQIDVPIVDQASVPTDVDLFRPSNFPTYILGTERFKDAVDELNLTGIIFQELRLA